MKLGNGDMEVYYAILVLYIFEVLHLKLSFVKSNRWIDGWIGE